MFKKAISGILASLLCVGMLAGCSSAGSSSAAQAGSGSTAGTDSTAQTTESAGSFVLFQRKSELNEIFERLAKIYEEETGVSIEVWGDMGDGYINTLQGKLTSGFGPTIFTVRTGTETELLAPYLTDLSDLAFVDSILDNLELMSNGSLVGIPYGLEGYGLLMNNELVSSADVTDLASFESTLQALSAQGVTPVELSEQTFFMIVHILNVPFALQADPLGFVEQLAAGEVKLAETPEFQEWAQYYELIREYGPNPMEVSYDQQIADFANGEAAIIHQGNWTNVLFDEYDVSFDLEIAPLPVAGNNAISVGVPNFFAVNSQASAEEQAAAKDFLNWLYGSETGKEFMVNDLQLIPTVEGVEAPNLDSMSQQVLAAAQSGDALMWTYNYWPNNIAANYLLPAAQEFFMDSSISGQDFLVMLDDAWAQATAEV